MQLLGIYLYKQTPKAVRKVLVPDWYPFGDYKRPGKGRPVRIKQNWKETAAFKVYQREGLPEITVNCIVGMNGAGKSTLLDLLYMSINNMAVRLLGKKAKLQSGRSLSYARGLYADFFFLCEENQYRISCRDIQTKLYILNEETKSFRILSIRNNDDAKSILSKLFYTISTNYSLYAFNQSEYVAEEDEPADPEEALVVGIDGEWLSGLFHKNDGYFTPIVITPYRETGNISVQKENRLASQRIMALALLQKAQNVSFIDRYEPTILHYEFDKDYKSKTEKTYQQSIIEQYDGLDIRHVIRSFETAWEQVFFEEHDDETVADEYHDQYEMALFYMAYKSVKICMTYEDYRKAFGVNKLIKVCKNLDDFTKYVSREVPAKAKAVIRKLMNERIDNRGDKNHITLKLFICKDYIESLYDNNPQWSNYEDKPVGMIIAGKNIKTFNDAVSLLPPAFYHCNMKFSKRDDLPVVQDSSWGITLKDSFSLSKMSSGERQMLYSLSYVLYHIKNIQSVREDENRVAYHNICLIFDEAELYFHPDYQRRFLGMLLESLSWCNIDIEKIHSIQILIVTHSPFILTDMLVQNSLYLKEGKRKKVDRETFGANYYAMLNKSFFFEKRAIGDVSGRLIGEWIRLKNNKEQISEEQMALVGDEVLRNYLKSYVQD